MTDKGPFELIDRQPPALACVRAQSTNGSALLLPSMIVSRCILQTKHSIVD